MEELNYLDVYINVEELKFKITLCLILGEHNVFMNNLNFNLDLLANNLERIQQQFITFNELMVLMEKSQNNKVEH